MHRSDKRLNIHEGAEEMNHFVDEVLANPAFITALKGESGYLARMEEIERSDQKIKFTEGMLRHASFIKKMIPDHIIEDNHVALVVAAVERLQDPEFNH